MVEHEGNVYEGIEEEDRVAGLVADLLKVWVRTANRTKRRFTYNMQVRRLERRLPNIRVGIVDNFQRTRGCRRGLLHVRQHGGFIAARRGILFNHPAERGDLPCRNPGRSGRESGQRLVSFTAGVIVMSRMPRWSINALGDDVSVVLADSPRLRRAGC